MNWFWSNVSPEIWSRASLWNPISSPKGVTDPYATWVKSILDVGRGEDGFSSVNRPQPLSIKKAIRRYCRLVIALRKWERHAPRRWKVYGPSVQGLINKNGYITISDFEIDLLNYKDRIKWLSMLSPIVMGFCYAIWSSLPSAEERKEHRINDLVNAIKVNWWDAYFSDDHDIAESFHLSRMLGTNTVHISDIVNIWNGTSDLRLKHNGKLIPIEDFSPYNAWNFERRLWEVVEHENEIIDLFKEWKDLHYGWTSINSDTVKLLKIHEVPIFFIRQEWLSFSLRKWNIDNFLLLTLDRNSWEDDGNLTIYVRKPQNIHSSRLLFPFTLTPEQQKEIPWTVNELRERWESVALFASAAQVTSQAQENQWNPWGN